MNRLLHSGIKQFLELLHSAYRLGLVGAVGTPVGAVGTPPPWFGWGHWDPSPLVGAVGTPPPLVQGASHTP